MKLSCNSVIWWSLPKFSYLLHNLFLYLFVKPLCIAVGQAYIISYLDAVGCGLVIHFLQWRFSLSLPIKWRCPSDVLICIIRIHKISIWITRINLPWLSWWNKHMLVMLLRLTCEQCRTTLVKTLICSTVV